MAAYCRRHLRARAIRFFFLPRFSSMQLRKIQNSSFAFGEKRKWLMRYIFNFVSSLFSLSLSLSLWTFDSRRPSIGQSAFVGQNHLHGGQTRTGRPVLALRRPQLVRLEPHGADPKVSRELTKFASKTIAKRGRFSCLAFPY